MTFDEVLAQVQELLQQEQRVSYRGLKRRFALDDEYLEDLKEELIGAKQLATDEEGRFLVWTGDQEPTATPPRPLSHRSPTPSAEPHPLEAERRQLTVMFCDLVGSTALSEQLDPEELRDVVRAYQQTSTAVIDHYEGHIAQHLGDGLLVYFGYPAAHEDDAQRAVRTALGIVEAMQRLSFPTLPLPRPLQVRIGVHTGLVVIGEIGSSEKREILALGETPNIAARIQGQAEPDTVVISGATYRLVQGLFECQDRGLQALKGLSTPLPLYRVVRESEARSRFDAAVSKGLTPLVGRDEELGLLRRRWEQAKVGEGQVVLLSGEPGIGKSRLVQELKEQLGHEGVRRIEFHCSPYHQNSALYPIIDHLQCLLQFEREDSPAVKLEKLQHTLRHYRFAQTATVPLFAALLSLPHPAGYPAITVSPQKQKEQTQAALVAWLVEEAEQQPVYTTWEDVHWADPSTLEVLHLIVDQAPTARLYVLLTFRPEFIPPWGNRSHVRQLTLSRLERRQVEAMTERVTGGKALPVEAVQQIVAKTDGIPLFVEELTKMIVESGLVKAVNHHYELTQPLSALVIPATLQDSLMARLDRLARGKEVAQLAATIGREFSYGLLQAVALLPESRVQAGLNQLVAAELIQQRRDLSQVTYHFKHALIQDTAYESLLKSKRRAYHQRIAQVLEGHFPETVETQPELVAHHYTEAGLVEQAIPYWQRAGQRASQRSAFVEAVSHCTKGLALLKTQPDTPERAQQELMLQVALGGALINTKGTGAFEVGETYARARALCQWVGETPQLFPVLWGLRVFYLARGEYQTARELGEQMLRLAQSVQDPVLLVGAHYSLETSLFFLGEFALTRVHFEQGVALYDPQQHRSYTSVYGLDPGIPCLANGSWVLWLLGYPDQALKRSYEALTLAQELSHPPSLAFALLGADILHNFRREGQAAQERAEAAIALSREQGLPFYLTAGLVHRGWALAQQGQAEEGIAQIREGLTASRAIGTEAFLASYLGDLAEAYRTAGQPEEGLAVVAEALAVVDKTGERWWEAELYRLKGELTLQSKVPRLRSKVEQEAEECFQKATEIAQQQSAKSLELRTAMSLSRLWQQQGKKDEARQLLAEIYGWFSEGFDTKDLQEAKALLEGLA
jgi:TOMM system kinase/cyclase fusion protein